MSELSLSPFSALLIISPTLTHIHTLVSSPTWNVFLCHNSYHNQLQSKRVKAKVVKLILFCFSNSNIYIYHFPSFKLTTYIRFLLLTNWNKLTRCTTLKSCEVKINTKESFWQLYPHIYLLCLPMLIKRAFKFIHLVLKTSMCKIVIESNLEYLSYLALHITLESFSKMTSTKPKSSKHDVVYMIICLTHLTYLDQAA